MSSADLQGDGSHERRSAAWKSPCTCYVQEMFPPGTMLICNHSQFSLDDEEEEGTLLFVHKNFFRSAGLVMLCFADESKYSKTQGFQILIDSIVML